MRHVSDTASATDYKRELILKPEPLLQRIAYKNGFEAQKRQDIPREKITKGFAIVVAKSEPCVPSSYIDKNDLTCSPSTVLITLILGNRLAVYIIGWYALSRTLGGVW